MTSPARDTSPRRAQFATSVAANEPLCREHFRLVLALPEFPPTEPGQFIQIACRSADSSDGDARDMEGERELDWSPGQAPAAVPRELAGPLAVLRRPFSLAGRRDSTRGVELDVIHRVVGVGTDWLARLCPGDMVNILGPLGNRFEPPPDDAPVLLVGGGVGIPPMIYLAQQWDGRPAVAFSGALTRDLLPFTLTGGASPLPDDLEPRMAVAEFARHGIPVVLSTDDGSYGFRGFVTQALEQYLDRPTTARDALPRPVIYTCGPEPMMKRVQAIAAARGLACQIAVERAMACGMGTCQSCCIRVRKPDPAQPPLAGRDWCYRLACTDGPVFRGSDLLW